MTNEPLIKVRMSSFAYDKAIDKTKNGQRLTNSLNGRINENPFEQCEMHPKEFVEAAAVYGWGFTSWVKGGSSVSNKGFLESNHLPVDIDGTISLDDFLAYDFAKSYCYGYYTSKSHTDEAHRFRALFRTERDIKDGAEYSYAIQGLFQVFDNHLDEACKNSGRIWFGSVNADKWEYFGDDKVIDNETLDSLIALGKKVNDNNSKPVKAAPTITSNGFSGSLSVDHMFEDGRGHTFTPMDVFLDQKKRQCKCPFHNDKQPSAFVTYYDKTDSVWFFCSSSKCGEKRSMNPVATDVFNKKVKFSAGDDTQIVNLNDRYLPDIKVEDKDRLIFVKSPKGTGKTEFLGKISEQAQAESKKLLNLGHRVFLLSNLSGRLKTDYYLDHKDVSDNFSLCVNSLSRINPESDKPPEYVILDESEQFLINMVSSTLKRNRNEVFNNLLWVLQNAKHVICCDADLTYDISIDLVRKMMGLDENFTDFKVYNNTWQFDRSINLYASKNQLICDLYNDIKAGKRVFVTTNNSKDFINYLVTIIGFIEQEQGIEIPKLVVTADTNTQNDVKHFIKSPGSESMKYQVVLASPTLSTGVSIDGEVFDSVYGIFNNKIYTYQECDQAISRVRSCDNVNVFIQPSSAENSKSEAQLYKEIIDSEVKTTSLGVYGPNGRVFNEAELIYTEFYARIRTFYDNCLLAKAQKFTRLVQSNGYTVKFIELNPALNDIGKELIDLAKAYTTDTVIRRIMNSEDIPEIEADSLSDSKQALSVIEKYSLRKFKIAEFFGIAASDLTFEHVESVEKGKVMKKYSNIALMYSDVKSLINRDASERVHSKDISPHFKHRAREQQLMIYLFEASGIDMDVVTKNACVYADIIDQSVTAANLKKGSREYKKVRKEINAKISDIKIVVQPAQIDHFAVCVDQYKNEINEVFGTNIKDPTQESAKMKVFNSLMGRFNIKLSSSRKVSNGKQVKEYFIDYSCLKTIAKKIMAEKEEIMNEFVAKPVIFDELPIRLPQKIDLKELISDQL